MIPDICRHLIWTHFDHSFVVTAAVAHSCGDRRDKPSGGEEMFDRFPKRASGKLSGLGKGCWIVERWFGRRSRFAPLCREREAILTTKRPEFYLCLTHIMLRCPTQSHRSLHSNEKLLAQIA